MGTLLAILIVIVLIIVVVAYNSLQKLSQNVKEKASNVQVAISKKMTLINQLIDTVKNYQESEQFTQLKIAQDTNAANLMASYQQSGALLSSIQGFAERYPNLKASEQYQKLMDNISECELDVQKCRELYNQSVKEYNTKRSAIPTVFVAQFIGFSEAPYLQFDVSGNDSTSLKEFKTDDGERLKQLLKSAGSNISGAAKSLSAHAADAGKMISGNVLPDHPVNSFYYMIPGGVPKGPKPLGEIQQLIAEGSIPTETKVAELGSDDWKDIDMYNV